ncbi:MAG: hypothetical protein GY951_13050 [Psychromonas sp.]|nr:hypothetical protein [Psychromonas sp.]
MNIVIKSRFKFSEAVHDKAFGLAKKMVIHGHNKAVKRVGEFVLTARKTTYSVFIKVQRLSDSNG